MWRQNDVDISAPREARKTGYRAGDSSGLIGAIASQQMWHRTRRIYLALPVQARDVQYTRSSTVVYEIALRFIFNKRR